MQHLELRSRIERLLKGDIRIDDLTTLFFHMREEHGGNAVVRDITNFRAHPVVRTQRFATSDLRDLFSFLKFRMQIAESQIYPTVVPPTMPDALRANLRRMRKSTLKREAGTNPTHAKRVLERILRRMLPTGHGGLKKPALLDQEEHDVFMCIASHIKGGPVFSENDLFKEFVQVLQRMDVLKEAEKVLPERVRVGLALFALISMHNRAIDLGDGSLANIYVAADIFGNLGTFAFTEIVPTIGDKQPLTGVGWVFQTDLPIEAYCEEGVAPPGRAPFVGPLEMSRDLKLARLPLIPITGEE
jgi:hypothetical protein